MCESYCKMNCPKIEAIHHGFSCHLGQFCNICSLLYAADDFQTSIHSMHLFLPYYSIRPHEESPLSNSRQVSRGSSAAALACA